MAWIDPNARMFDFEQQRYSGKATTPAYSPTPIPPEDPTLTAYRKKHAPPQVYSAPAPSPSSSVGPLQSIETLSEKEKELRQLRQWLKGFMSSMSLKISNVRKEIDESEAHLNEARIRFRKLQDEFEQVHKYVHEDYY
jgi:hypothetical protein